MSAKATASANNGAQRVAGYDGGELLHGVRRASIMAASAWRKEWHGLIN